MSARFKAGDRVLVRAGFPPGHIRTPAYLRGKRGTIVGDFGAWPNPEELAYGKSGEPAKVNYWVRFEMDEIWAGDGKYGPADSVVAEIYEHWLEPAR
jgi:nitrile hydratase